MRIGWNAYDAHLLCRTLIYAAVGLGLSLGIQVATDEPGSTPAMRLARLCAFTPVLAGLAAWAALRLAREAGELASLEALGASYWRLRLGPILGAWALGVASTVLLGTSLTDVAALLPRLTQSAAWHFSDGAFWAPDGAVGIAPDTSIRYGTLTEITPAIVAERPAALIATSAWALWLPPWLLVSMRGAVRAVGALASLALGLVALHAVAAAAWSWPWTAIVMLPLAGQLMLAARDQRSLPEA